MSTTRLRLGYFDRACQWHGLHVAFTCGLMPCFDSVYGYICEHENYRPQSMILPFKKYPDEKYSMWVEREGYYNKRGYALILSYRLSGKNHIRHVVKLKGDDYVQEIKKICGYADIKSV